MATKKAAKKAGRKPLPEGQKREEVRGIFVKKRNHNYFKKKVQKWVDRYNNQAWIFVKKMVCTTCETRKPKTIQTCFLQHNCKFTTYTTWCLMWVWRALKLSNVIQQRLLSITTHATRFFKKNEATPFLPKKTVFIHKKAYKYIR